MFLFVLINFLKYNNLITNEKKAAELRILSQKIEVSVFFSKHTLLVILYKNIYK